MYHTLKPSRTTITSKHHKRNVLTQHQTHETPAKTPKSKFYPMQTSQPHNRNNQFTKHLHTIPNTLEHNPKTHSNKPPPSAKQNQANTTLPRIPKVYGNPCPSPKRIRTIPLKSTILYQPSKARKTQSPQPPTGSAPHKAPKLPSYKNSQQQ